MSHPDLLDNPTRIAITSAVEAGVGNTPLHVNPALAALDTRFVAGQKGQLTLQFTAPPDSIQGNGVVGGGVLASMLDIAMALSILSALPPGRTCATISLNVDMLNAARLGDFFAEAKIKKVGRSIAFAEASLFMLEHKQLVATATASFAVLDERRA